VALAVSLRSAVCLLDRYPALAGVDVDIAPGEIVLCSGANGAGKTTLLRLLAGLVPLAGGTGEVLGFDLARERGALRRHVGLLGHDTGCYDDLTVAENLHFAATAAGRARRDVAAAAADALGRTGLTARASVRHGRLSAGQRRRLALAATLVRDPRLLLLDEPHAGLDDDGRAALDAIVAAAPMEDRTVVLVSHELERARALSGREITLVTGQADARRTEGTGTEAPVPAPGDLVATPT